jgi:hypothetical protein
MIDRYVKGNSWSGLGIKLALGNPTDRVTTFSEKMFLPDYLGNDMAQAVVIRNGKESPLIVTKSMIVEAPPLDQSFSVTSPVVVILFFFFLVLVLTIWERRRNKRLIWLDVVVFFSFGIAALILYFTTFISVMTWTKWNLNLIWAWPTHFLLAILWMFPKMRTGLNWYIRLTTAVLVLFLLSMYYLPQTFHWLVVPICLIMVMRTVDKLPPMKRIFSREP